MKADQILKHLQLESKHWNEAHLKVPVIKTDLYTTLGRRLFETYQRFSIGPEDQRELESLVYLLTTFTLYREADKKSWLSSLKALFSR